MPPAKYVNGLIASSSPSCNVLPATYILGLITPYLVASHNGGPTNGNIPPINAPSAANLNLFLKLAVASSLPLNSSVSS